MSKKILFVDRDGCLIEEPADFQIDSYEKFKLLPGVIPALLKLKGAGYRMVMVTNQDALGTPKYPLAKFEMIQTLLLGILETQGLTFEEILVCPHEKSEGCLCRKPGIGLVTKYLADPSWDRKRSVMVGDRLTDVELGKNMGIGGIRVSPENPWSKIAAELLSLPRKGSCTRNTRETQITAEVCLDVDGAGESQISTGIGFFDHMLDQIARHAGFDLRLSVKGDLHIDDHHTVEDAALALGAALREALGDKNGIGRFGFHLPMDDASAQVAIDLSGRAYSKFEGGFDRESVGGLATEMVPHFFRSLADGLGANIHIRVEGDNTHHRVESAFKATGRALRAAIAQTGGPGVPSTKGSL
jgi:imidazoleglycerol-phosphate dehydratase/histidinol-phosphatase